ncbi:SIMPL domain-containing protein [Halobacteriales archaeon QH_10_65_19]|nr:MAG: SIMPL domain-containing protein [Halobacteriales archaeon QH_10_65_19]
MNRRTFIGLAGASTATVATAGCLSAGLGSTGSQSEDVTLDDVENLNVETTDRNTIQVQGIGRVAAEPNSVTLSASIEAHDRDDASTVVEELATRSEQLIEDLTAYGIPEDSITTARYSLGEHSRRNRYEGEHRFSIEVDDPDNAGEVIDVAAGSEADQIGRVNFTVTGDKRDELYDEAVKRAVADAREEAELYAGAADVSLGDPVSIETTQRGVSPHAMSLSMTAGDAVGSAPPTELEQGQVSVSARATIEYGFDAGNGES